MPHSWVGHAPPRNTPSPTPEITPRARTLARGEHGVAQARIVWRGGATSELSIRMQVNSVAALERGAEMMERILELARDGKPDEEIAANLTADGHRSPSCVDRVLPITVQRIRLGAGLKVTPSRTRWTHGTGMLSAQELAKNLNIPVNWLYVQIRKGRIAIDRQPTGAYLFGNSATVAEAVQDLRKHRVRHLDLRISQPQQEGHQHA